MSNELASIVITTKNEENNIENCLLSIREQTYSNIECIVVDNNSDDKTKEIAKKYTSNVFNKGPERCAQRNFGMIDIAKGNYVIFVDADMILSKTLIESCVKYVTQNNVDALFIKEIILGKTYWSKVRRFERYFYDGTVVDGLRFFRKDIFKEVGGFDEKLVGADDWDLDKRIKNKGKVELLPSINKNFNKNWALNEFIRSRGVQPTQYHNVIFHNESDFILSTYLKKKKYYINSFDEYIGKWGDNDPDILKQLGVKYRLFGVFVENGKWLNLVKSPFLTVSMYILRFLVGLTYIMNRG